MIDPNCCHKVQCTKGPFSLQNGFVRENEEYEANSSDDERDDGSSSAERPSSETVTRYQRGNTAFCCGHGKDANYGARDYGYVYSFILFEKCTGDALSFFAQRDNWTEEKQAEIRAVHPWLRVCCRKCRYEYENYCFVKRHDD